MSKLLVGGVFAALLGGALTAAAPPSKADWPMLGRNSTRNAVSPEKGGPLHWQREIKNAGRVVHPARNVKWEATLGSNNFASPVVAGGLVWVGTNNDRPRDPAIKGDASVLMCFREADGKFLWQYVSPRLNNDSEDYRHASLNNAPLAEGDRLTFTTNRGEVVCLDVGPLRRGTGKPRPIWKLDMRKQLGVHPVGAAMNLGFTCSLGASYKGRLYVCTGNGVDYTTGRLPVPNAPSLLCLDRETGKVLWSDRSPGKNIFHSQWSSPLVAEVAGRGQVIAAQGDGWLRSFDALTGKLLWKFDGNLKKATPYKPGGGGERCFFTATPVLFDNKVYIGVGQDPNDGSGVGHLWCVDLVKATVRGKVNKDHDVSPVNDNFDPGAAVNKESALVWHYGGPVVPRPKDGEMEYVFGRTMSNVVVHDGLVIAPERAGYVHCLDARTGKPYWIHDTQDSIIASPLVVDGKVYVQDDGGTVTVLALSRTKKVLARNEMGWGRSAPVFAGGVLYHVAGWKLYALQAGEDDRPWGNWPQWRGPARDNISDEKGLLDRWPREGPPLAWEVQGLGDSPGTAAVAGGRVYVLGQRDGRECVTALEEATGKPIWSVAVGPTMKEHSMMRWLSPRTPVVDDALLFAVTARGDLVCLDRNGKEVWRKNYRTDFEGRSDVFGYCDHPLIDGNMLICAPGGGKATIVALNKETGEPIWKCPLVGETAGYGATVLSTSGGVRHYVAVVRSGLIGVSTRGKLLWRYTRFNKALHNCYAAIPHGNQVLAACGYGGGLALLELTPGKGGLVVKEQYHLQLSLPFWHEATAWVGDHLYLGANAHFLCLEVKTGKTLWEEKKGVACPVSMTCANGRLYLRSRDGKVVLVEVSPKGFVVKGTLAVPKAVRKPGSSSPVAAGGRLYLRDDDRLFCYDLRKGGKPGKPGSFTVGPVKVPPNQPRSGARREPDAVFVPTPQDVVEKMLELAKVKKTETLVDLGCGDGRIVVTAARKYGCKAVGYDIDPECVKMAEDNVQRAKLGALVAIERKDLFTVDLDKVDVVTLYLLPGMNERLLPRLARLRPGSRVVAHAFAIPGVVPDRVVAVAAKEDGVERKLFLYTTPLKKAKKPE